MSSESKHQPSTGAPTPGAYSVERSEGCSVAGLEPILSRGWSLFCREDPEPILSRVWSLFCQGAGACSVGSMEPVLSRVWSLVCREAWSLFWPLRSDTSMDRLRSPPDHSSSRTRRLLQWSSWKVVRQASAAASGPPLGRRRCIGSVASDSGANIAASRRELAS